MGESRTELIAWLNDLLGLNYTKVEQCGTGAAYTQIIDSIYGNVAMSKLNWTAKQDYEFLNNYKVLQDAFKKNHISKPIPVERLVKCKMQDNLEWLQWSKKFWDTNFPGHEYDAEGRRGGAPAIPPPLHGSVTVGAARGIVSRPSAATSTGSSAARKAGLGATRPKATTTTPLARTARATGSSGGGAGATAPMAAEIEAMSASMEEMRVSVGSLEKERDFYFGKLREIELLVQARLGNPEEEIEQIATGDEEETLKQIQAVLYSTEEGFEIPEGAEPPLGDEEETF